jgi:hypothetical protein
LISLSVTPGVEFLWARAATPHPLTAMPAMAATNCLFFMGVSLP